MEEILTCGIQDSEANGLEQNCVTLIVSDNFIFLLQLSQITAKSLV